MSEKPGHRYAITFLSNPDRSIHQTGACRRSARLASTLADPKPEPAGKEEAAKAWHPMTKITAPVDAPGLHKAIKQLAANPHLPEAFGEVVTQALDANRPELALAALQMAYMDKLGWCLNMIIKNGVTLKKLKKKGRRPQ
jgi:hypothetical protein